jgi:hypothetical protein
VTQEERRQREFAEALGRLELARGQRARIDDEILRRHEEIRRTQHSMHFAMRELVERWIVAQRAEAVRMDETIRRLAAESELRRAARCVDALRNQNNFRPVKKSEL